MLTALTRVARAILREGRRHPQGFRKRGVQRRVKGVRGLSSEDFDRAWRQIEPLLNSGDGQVFTASDAVAHAAEGQQQQQCPDCGSLVYFATTAETVGGEIRVKIGQAVDPVERLRALQVASPATLVLLHSFRTDTLCGHTLERNFQKHFVAYHRHGEWFAADRDILAVVHAYKTEGWLQGQAKRNIPQGAELTPGGYLEPTRVDTVSGMIRYEIPPGEEGCFFIFTQQRVNEMPIVTGYLKPKSHEFVIRCPFCKQKHRHTAYEGTRLAHCALRHENSNIEYYIRPKGADPSTPYLGWGEAGGLYVP